MKYQITAITLSGLLLLPGCATEPQQGVAVQRASYASYGVVTHVDVFNATTTGDSVAGAAVGGVLGGLLGHQFGGGRGNTATTIAGAAGGAYVGSKAGGQERLVYRVAVRLDNGDTASFDVATDAFRQGDRVEVRDGTLRRL
ncbi:MAG: glycine zipper 2TM domain-containing protein [Burkholderiales bacterium]|nr:glycine zipper 2TM domain-containing protein [Burkholderiales bacterium]